MHLLEHTPAPCAHCGKGNANGRSEPIRFVDLERDINWNDPLILCEDCVLILAGLIGLPTPDVLTDLKDKLREAEKNEHDAKVAVDRMTRRAKRLGVEFTSEKKVA